ncbi:MAG TPA: carboxypeptidase-like regulatory domain-containing protein, partial [Thermoanaerobaculia bacterium]|nr:carboxypeptidase-like regulatory domain-containing protein [Thermoanaerobaculia bacterium]
MATPRIGATVRGALCALLPLLFFVTAGAAVAQGDISQGPGERIRPVPGSFGPPTELFLTRAGSSTRDLRTLPQTRPEKFERPELEEPEIDRVELPGGPPKASVLSVPGPKVAAPPPAANFDGLDFATWGAGHPPDTNGDVGPTYFIQTVNTSIGIYLKTGGPPVAAFTFNTFMSQGAFGNLCDTNNFGDPVVLYDTFEDRWVITDFAFTLTGSAVNFPPGAFQCFAVSKTGDPVSGGWNFYSINTQFGLGDYPKFGVWPDGIYMSANMFGYGAGAALQNSRAYAFNKAQMYAGAPTVQVVRFEAPAGDFTLLPSNARLQTGTPPPGTPNYYVSTWEFLNALTVYKLHVDWDKISASTFTGPDTPLAATSWPNAAVPNALSQGGNALDVLQIRAMMQNQYTNLGGVESLWTAHTVRRAAGGLAAPRWYQVDVTGGTVAANLPQAATWDPDGANVISRFMPSVAVDRAGTMALGYSTSSSTTKPAIKYAARLSTDPVNTLGQTEQLLIQGAGTQTGNCGGSACIRWGDYSAMSLDPDGCTFWYTNMYYGVDGLNDLTRIGSFAFPSCTPVGAGGTLSGTVTATVGGAPISGATVTFGSRVATTNGSGFYSFSIPAGTYPTITASDPGYNSASASNISVTDGNTTTQNFSLDTAPTSVCGPAGTDTTQSDFQRGVPAHVDLTASPGDVVLPAVDQQNTMPSGTGVGITVATWGGQTFTPAVTGPLSTVDLNLFCNACTGTTPNLTLSVRATSGGLPTGADLATATIPGFNTAAASYFTVTFGSPPTLTGGTMYALVIRPVANPSAGTYALTRSGGDFYPG